MSGRIVVLTSTIIRRVLGVLAGLALTLAIALAGSLPAQAATTVWDKVAKCESGNRWHVSTGNGYYGGLQFSSSTWNAFGGRKYASQAHKASKAEQIAIARRVLASQGPGAWPTCSRRAGLTKSNGKADKNAVPATNPGATKAKAMPVAKKAKPAVKKAKAVVKKAPAVLSSRSRSSPAIPSRSSPSATTSRAAGAACGSSTRPSRTRTRSTSARFCAFDKHSGAGGSLPPSSPPVEARQTRICRASHLSEPPPSSGTAVKGQTTASCALRLASWPG